MKNKAVMLQPISTPSNHTKWGRDSTAPPITILATEESFLSYCEQNEFSSDPVRRPQKVPTNNRPATWGPEGLQFRICQPTRSLKDPDRQAITAKLEFSSLCLENGFSQRTFPARNGQHGPRTGPTPHWACGRYTQ